MKFGRILIVDDDIDMAEVLKSCLEHEGFRADCCQNLDEMKTKLKQYSFDAVLLDLFLGSDNGVEAIPFLLREVPFSVVVVMSAHGTIELAVEAMQRGAASFVSKSDDPGKIVDHLKERLRPKSEARIHQSQSLPEIFSELGMIGESEPMLELYQEIMHIKDTDVTVLISGESGTGKELVTRAIHMLSNRASKNFEAINCAAIPENLLESELFGYRKGAFTDAKTDRKGIFEVCADGSVLLDEIGEMPLGVQAKLLRVLQEKEFMPIGSSKSIKITTRMMAATNRDLELEVERGRFREDLYFRLNVVPLYLPPLRARRKDIPILVNTFVAKFNERYGKTVELPSRDVMMRIQAHDWPGNVRQLQNAVERGVVLAHDNRLRLEDLLASRMRRKSSEVDAAGGAVRDGDSFSYADAKEAFEKTYLIKILTAAQGSISEAARISGKYRSDIYRLMDRYKISVDDFK